jgi:thiol-disulfide isomerase/thioredoxin
MFSLSPFFDIKDGDNFLYRKIDTVLKPDGVQMGEPVTAGNSNIIAFSEADFWEKVLKSPIPFLVEIGAQWSGTCDIMVPVIEKLAIESAIILEKRVQKLLETAT